MLKKKLKNISSLLLISILFIQCQFTSKSETIALEEGIWRMEMILGEVMLPFNFSVKTEAGNYQFTIYNADEKIEVKEILQKGDSLFVQLPVYETAFYLKINSAKELSGIWKNYYREEKNEVPVIASFNKDYRFFKEETPATDLAKKFKVLFNPEKESPTLAMALFEQDKSHVKGTFVTRTGDFRFLEGQIKEDSLFLSAFDGSTAYLFKARFNKDTIAGSFWSGVHHHAYWKGEKDDDFELSNPDSLTFLKEGYDKLSFSFPNMEGKMISLEDSMYQNKVIIVQIMGSWCHNCLDETEFLQQLYQSYHQDGLEVIGLGFERTKSEEQAFKNLLSLKETTKAKYPFLLASWDRKEIAAEKLPMLNHIMAFPTSIFINRKGEIVKIHTGYYGPSSGDLHQKYIKQTTDFIEELLIE